MLRVLSITENEAPVDVATTETSEVPAGLSKQSLRHFPVALVIADARDPDYPIVFVNPAFTRMTGYEAAEVLGRNCRFLQGPRTDEDDRDVIRAALSRCEDVNLDIINYRKDGSSFVNNLMIVPLRDQDDDQVTHFLGVQNVIDGDDTARQEAHRAARRLSELQHRVKNHLTMVLSMIRMEADRRPGSAGFAEVIERRVAALALLYDDFVTGGDDHAVDAGAYLSRVAASVHGADGRPGVRLNLDVDTLMVPQRLAGTLGLILSEVLTNAFQHGFAAEDNGEVSVTLAARDGQAALSVRDDGCGLGEARWPDRGSLGGRIVRALAGEFGGAIGAEPAGGPPARPGTRVTLTFDHSPAPGAQAR